MGLQGLLLCRLPLIQLVANMAPDLLMVSVNVDARFTLNSAQGFDLSMVYE